MSISAVHSGVLPLAERILAPALLFTSLATLPPTEAPKTTPTVKRTRRPLQSPVRRKRS
ncbi:hypothetical protein FRB91_000076 [Serendipita sp. 411]|nr:hypothetical protein FRB91_000076 [Serendipita sp. 411]